MKICFVSSTHHPFDKRVFDKEAVTLATAGFEVTHLCPDRKPMRVVRGVQIVPIPPLQGILERAFSIPRLYVRARRIRTDCYHCNEVDSWLVGVLLKLTTGRKVVFDVHEHYPSTFAESRFVPFLRPIVAAGVRFLFRLLTPFTDRLVLANRLVAPDFRGSESKQVLVQNFIPLAYDRPRASLHQDNGNGRNLRAIHVGLINRARGWPQLLEALKETLEPVRLSIVGSFNDNSRTDFERRALELGVRDRIEILEWLPFDEALDRIIGADVGLILFQPGRQNNVFALPHKMFDYMLAAIPVVAPNFAKQISQIVREADCGILVDPSRPADIAAALDRLADPAERRRLGENGRRAVLQLYNWEAEAVKLVAMYKELEQELETGDSVDQRRRSLSR